MTETGLANTQSLNAYMELPAVVGRLSEKLGLEEAKRFKAAISASVSANPALLKCEPGSVVNAHLIGHSLNLPPSPQLGYYYVVPYKNRKKGCTDGQFQMGYKGYIQLAMRSGYYKKLNVVAIKDGEFESWNPLTEELNVSVIEDPIERDKAQTVGYFGYFEYINGFTKTMYWALQKMELHADKYSKAYSLASDKLLKAGKIPQKDLWKYASYWYEDFDGMGMKTIVRQLLSKWGSMNVDMQKAYEQDIKSDSVSYAQAAQTASATVENEQGSEEVDAEFEPKTETETEELETNPDDPWPTDPWPQEAG